MLANATYSTESLLKSQRNSEQTKTVFGESVQLWNFTINEPFNGEAQLPKSEPIFNTDDDRNSS